MPTEVVEAVASTCDAAGAGTSWGPLSRGCGLRRGFNREGGDSAAGFNRVGRDSVEGLSRPGGNAREGLSCVGEPRQCGGPPAELPRHGRDLEGSVPVHLSGGTPEPAVPPHRPCHSGSPSRRRTRLRRTERRGSRPMPQSTPVPAPIPAPPPPMSPPTPASRAGEDSSVPGGMVPSQRLDTGLPPTGDGVGPRAPGARAIPLDAMPLGVPSSAVQLDAPSAQGARPLLKTSLRRLSRHRSQPHQPH